MVAEDSARSVQAKLQVDFSPAKPGDGFWGGQLLRLLGDSTHERHSMEMKQLYKFLKIQPM